VLALRVLEPLLAPLKALPPPDERALEEGATDFEPEFALGRLAPPDEPPKED